VIVKILLSAQFRYFEIRDSLSVLRPFFQW